MNMKKWIAAALACSALALSACGGRGKDAAAPAANPGKVYRVASNAEFAPFESLDSKGNVEGFDVDLMNAMAKAGNFKIEFKHQPWDSLFPALNNGDADVVMSGVTITDDRKQSMDFSDPYFEITQVVLVPKGKKVSSSEDLKKMNKVGVVTLPHGRFLRFQTLGQRQSENRALRKRPPDYQRTGKRRLGFRGQRQRGHRQLCEKQPGKGMDFVTLPDFTTEHYGIAVRKGDEATVKMLNDALEKVRESGEYDKIYAKYFAKEGGQAAK